MAGAHATDGEDDGHHDEGHGGGQDHVQPDVEVRTLGQATNLEIAKVSKN